MNRIHQKQRGENPIHDFYSGMYVGVLTSNDEHFPEFQYRSYCASVVWFDSLKLPLENRYCCSLPMTVNVCCVVFTKKIGRKPLSILMITSFLTHGSPYMINKLCYSGKCGCNLTIWLLPCLTQICKLELFYTKDKSLQITRYHNQLVNEQEINLIHLSLYCDLTVCQHGVSWSVFPCFPGVSLPFMLCVCVVLPVCAGWAWQAIFCNPLLRGSSPAFHQLRLSLPFSVVESW